jgi:hypothetical protein
MASIQEGQKAASSLSKAGGAAPNTELTPEALANMSDESLLRSSTNYKLAATRRS